MKIKLQAKPYDAKAHKFFRKHVEQIFEASQHKQPKKKLSKKKV